MKVMVVDDNAIVRLGLQSVLQRIEAVHEVIAADSAFSALEAHHAHSPDIILLDISMPPGRSGLEILPELARDASVIMLTSNRDPSSIREALPLKTSPTTHYALRSQTGRPRFWILLQPACPTAGSLNNCFCLREPSKIISTAPIPRSRSTAARRRSPSGCHHHLPTGRPEDRARAPTRWGTRPPTL